MMLSTEELLTTGLIAPFSLGQAISRGVSPISEPPLPISHKTQVHLMTAFIRETARWCETTDTAMHFSTTSIHELMESKPFVAAAMALASRQLDTVQNKPRHMTLELYQHTISLLLGQDPAQADSSVLATCTLLCVYEMMASSVADCRRHLKVSLYSSFRVLVVGHTELAFVEGVCGFVEDVEVEWQQRRYSESLLLGLCESRYVPPTSLVTSFSGAKLNRKKTFGQLSTSIKQPSYPPTSGSTTNPPSPSRPRAT